MTWSGPDTLIPRPRSAKFHFACGTVTSRCYKTYPAVKRWLKAINELVKASLMISSRDSAGRFIAPGVLLHQHSQFHESDMPSCTQPGAARGQRSYKQFAPEDMTCCRCNDLIRRNGHKSTGTTRRTSRNFNATTNHEFCFEPNNTSLNLPTHFHLS